MQQDFEFARSRGLAGCKNRHKMLRLIARGDVALWGSGGMLKAFAVLSVLVVAAPTLAVADSKKNDNSSQSSSSSSQNLTGVPFTANDPPTTDFNSNSKGKPAGFPPVPGCSNGVAKGNPHCQPASP